MMITEKLKNNIRDYYKCFQKSNLKNKKLKKSFVENWIELLENIDGIYGEHGDNLLKQVASFFMGDLEDLGKAIQFQAGYDYFLFYSRNLGKNQIIN